ncbi:LexA-binding, inner membrane-associated putative hydrolase [uncultured archaeon]|nr:LexA-binding, inner membrane-associated putative hydrolase [uncultured archaeon]
MDWISHLLFSLALGAILLKDRTREKMVLVALASLFPDLDILWYHRSILHSPFVLLLLALVLIFRNRAFFAPLLISFWSHSALDIFLFDNSNHTIKNLANQVVGNESIAQHIEDNITRYASADGIMLFWPFSGERFSITLEEKSYAIVAGFIIMIAMFSFLWLYFKKLSRK